MQNNKKKIYVDTSSINYEGDRVVKSLCAQLTVLRECYSAVMNITGAISVMNHTHFRSNER